MSVGSDPTRKIHDLDDEELVEMHNHFHQIVAYGDPDAVTEEDVRKLERVEIELAHRLAHSVLLDE